MEEPDVSAASEPTDQGIEHSKTSQEPEKPSTSQGKTLVSKLTRKRKANKVERALDNVIEKFTSAQNSSEEKFYELEEKRLKQEMALEEKRMSLENDRRKQELEHEMRLMVMMTQMFTRSCASYGTPPPPLPPPEWGMSGYNLTPPFTSMPPHSNQDSTDSYSQDL